ncbi:MAG: ATP-binding protein [Bacteroidetes bacterium]|nr:ATP-binding protein [Bacteroidota bacterium]
MLSQEQKNAILELIDEEKERIGSYRAVAKKCGISETAISLLRKGTYGADTDEVMTKIGVALGYDFDCNSWKIADITNFRIITEVLHDAKSESMFMGIAHPAGSGKTATSDAFLNRNRRNACFKVNCKEWGGRQFLCEVAKEIGAEMPKGYNNINVMIACISETFKRISAQKPLLIIDQANSLKPSALRTFIHIFNECEDILGVVILGTENLEYEIKRGVRLNRTGYDEFDSRFGRKYIHLIGATLGDTIKICEVNGITDADTQKRIFADCNPTRITLEDSEKTITVVADFRRIKRLVKAERLKVKKYGYSN